MDHISSTTWEIEENGQPKQVTRLQAARDDAKAEIETLERKPWINPQISSPLFEVAVSAFQKNYAEAMSKYVPIKDAVLAYKNEHAERANRTAALEARETQLYLDIQKCWIEFQNYNKDSHLTRYTQKYTTWGVDELKKKATQVYDFIIKDKFKSIWGMDKDERDKMQAELNAIVKILNEYNNIKTTYVDDKIQFTEIMEKEGTMSKRRR